MASRVPSERRSITLRLSGTWAQLWNQLRKAVPGVAEAELLRQGVVLRAALAARDSRGNKPTLWLEYTDESGRLVRADVEQLLGLEEPPDGPTKAAPG
jgi:hypothetical protein